MSRRAVEEKAELLAVSSKYKSELLANMSDEAAPVALDLPGLGEVRVRRLDDETVYAAASDPDAYRRDVQPLGAGGATVAIELPPFGLLTLDSETDG